MVKEFELEEFIPDIKTMIKLAIADDHCMFREAIVSIINGWENYNVVVQSSNGKELLSKILHRDFVDVILLDINMPELNGFDT